MPVLFSLRGVESIFRPAWPTGLTDHRHRRAKFRVDRPILGASAPKTWKMHKFSNFVAPGGDHFDSAQGRPVWPIFMKFIHFICSSPLQKCVKFSVCHCVIGGVMGPKAPAIDFCQNFRPTLALKLWVGSKKKFGGAKVGRTYSIHTSSSLKCSCTYLLIYVWWTWQNIL